VIPGERTQQEATRLLHQARAAFSAGRLPETIELCRRILTIDPDNLTAYLLWAYAELPGENYLQLLARIHRHLRPGTYVGIGIETGACLTCAEPHTTIIGIDPKPQLKYRFGDQVRIFAETSDDFFARRDLFKELGRPVDLAFIDGMHLLEFALRDFINLERHALPTSTILAHDCLPLDERSSRRERVTTFSSGDTWRLIPCLKQYRPDLQIHTVATPPTGLAIIRQLDPSSTVLRDNLERISAEFASLPYSVLDGAKREQLNCVPNDWPTVRALL
jgi:hypothetical protein